MLTPKERGSEKRQYEVYPNCHKFCYIYSGLRHSLISKFSWRSMPADPTTTLCAIRTQTTARYACCISPHSLRTPRLLQSLDPPVTLASIPPSSNGHLEGHQWHDHHKCLVEMLQVWLKRLHPSPTWSAIIDAVVFLREEQLGRKLREKYQLWIIIAIHSLNSFAHLCKVCT